jgi:exodeoxyribonuclease V beta subunit
VHTLPANSDTGLLIHRILEKASFSDVHSFSNSSELIPFVRPFVRHGLCKNWEDTLSEMAFNALKAPLFPMPFSLSQLREGCHYREMSFLFPHQQELKIEGLSFFEGMIKGIVDLFCCYEDRYYLVDWKSNWLGPDCGSYQQPSLHAAMKEHGYYLQAAIYSEAVKRYLRIVDPRPFEECFGGVFYLFLRGMQPGTNTGILYLRPNRADLLCLT